ncbi:unnamed protein product [Dibothriocephalus latus]|uniref:Uncharacterized protein n=1 Tax=Dibothriocephalus latus TaxID=60516 RepID=A0A3P6S6I8_DIBLA|nr:unnamed protein product [Dibothriocephalus latus]
MQFVQALSGQRKQLVDKEKDRIEVEEAQLSDCSRRLYAGGVISDRGFESLRPVGTQIPRLCGLRIIHKDGLPVPPILDIRNSPYHAIAKWVAAKLKPLQHQLAPRSYRDTFDFIDDIKDVNLNGMIMFSIDVSSLLTNVPVIETVEYICEFP